MADNSRNEKSGLLKIKIDKKTLIKKARKVESATTKHAHKFLIKRWNSVRDVKRHVILWVMVMGILIAATGLQLMWFQKSYLLTDFAKDGTYAEATLGLVDTLNPIFADTSAEQSANYLMFSRLLRYDKAGKLGFDLATNITTNEAKTEYTVSIRPDVLWHDGKRLTTDDIAFTVGLLQDSDVRATIAGWSGISAQIISPTEIKFILKGPYAAFEHVLTFPVIPKHILGNVAPRSILENKFSQSPVGSGPFKFEFIQESDSESGHKIVYLVRNDDYYGGRAKLARFQLHTYMSRDDILRGLSNNEVNAAADLSPIDIKNIDKNRYEISSTSVQSGLYALFNVRSNILQDSTVRRAIELATDTSAIRAKLMQNTKSLNLPFTDGQISGDLPKVPPFSVANSIKIFEENGWVVGKDGIRQKGEVELKLSVVAFKDSEFEAVLESLTKQWREVGVAVETKVVDPSDIPQNVAQNILQPRNFDVLLYQLNIGADPDVYAYWHSSQASIYGYNFSNYNNTISDDALSSARVRTEMNLRNAKYLTFARQWVNDVPAVGLYQSTVQYVHNKNVKTFADSNLLVSSDDRYWDVLDWSVGSRTVYKTP